MREKRGLSPITWVQTTTRPTGEPAFMRLSKVAPGDQAMTAFSQLGGTLARALAERGREPAPTVMPGAQGAAVAAAMTRLTHWTYRAALRMLPCFTRDGWRSGSSHFGSFCGGHGAILL